MLCCQKKKVIKQRVKLATSFAVKYKIFRTVEVLTEIKLKDKLEDIAVEVKQNLLNNDFEISSLCKYDTSKFFFWI
jgi:hypothetical protein